MYEFLVLDRKPSQRGLEYIDCILWGEGVIPTQKEGPDITMNSVWLHFWRSSIPYRKLFVVPIWLGVVVHVRVSSMDEIDLLKIYLYFIEILDIK